jgi:hypothetical protein
MVIAGVSPDKGETGMFYEIHPHNDESLTLTYLRMLVEGVVFVGFLCSTLLAVVVFAAWTGVL